MPISAPDPLRPQRHWAVTMNLADQLARIEQAPKGPNVGAFFDLDGTLVAGYTATAFFREQVAGRHVDPGTALRSLVAAVDGTFLGGSPIKGSQLAFAALAGKDESLEQAPAKQQAVGVEERVGAAFLHHLDQLRESRVQRGLADAVEHNPPDGRKLVEQAPRRLWHQVGGRFGHSP